METNALLWISEAPAQEPQKPQLTRRGHRKSRRGCLTCKARRVKCDEMHPVCGNCSLRATKCEYGQHCSSNRREPAKAIYPTPPESLDEAMGARARSDAAKGSRKLQPGIEKNPLASEAALGFDVFATSIASMTRTHALTNTSSNTLPFLLHHFTSSAYATLSSYTGQKIIKAEVPGLAMQFPFLLDTILAFSARHVAYLGQEQRTKTPKRREMDVAASWHAVRALRSYGKTISDYRGGRRTKACGRTGSKPAFSLGAKDDERRELDALVAACLMLTSLFYHIEWNDNQIHVWSSPWVPEETPDAVGLTKTVNDYVSCVESADDGLPTPFLDDPPPFVFLDGGYSSLHGPAAQNRSTRHWAKPKCDWFTNVTGMSILLSLTPFQEHLPYSIWFPFFAEANERRNSRLQDKVRGSKDSSSFAENVLQELNSTQREPLGSPGKPCDAFEPPFQSPEPERLLHLRTLLLLAPQHQATCGPLVTHLTSLLVLSPSNLNNFGQIISFPTQISPGMPLLVANRNVIALLILGYWFGMLEGVPHWWCHDRGRAEGSAIQGWLVNLVRSMANVVKGWGAVRESEGDRRWREGSARAVEEFVAWRKMRNLG